MRYCNFEPKNYNFIVISIKSNYFVMTFVKINDPSINRIAMTEHYRAVLFEA